MGDPYGLGLLPSPKSADPFGLGPPSLPSKVAPVAPPVSLEPAEVMGWVPDGFAGTLHSAGEALRAAKLGAGSAVDAGIGGLRRTGYEVADLVTHANPNSLPGGGYPSGLAAFLQSRREGANYVPAPLGVDPNSSAVPYLAANDEIGQRFVGASQRQAQEIANLNSPFARGVGHGAEIATNLGAAIADPFLMAPLAYGEQRNIGKSVPGSAFVGALNLLPAGAGKAAERLVTAGGEQVARALPAAMQYPTRVAANAPVVTSTAAQGGIGAAMAGGTAAETALFENMPELARMEAESIPLSGGVGATLGAILSRGRVHPGTGPLPRPAEPPRPIARPPAPLEPMSLPGAPAPARTTYFGSTPQPKTVPVSAPPRATDLPVTAPDGEFPVPLQSQVPRVEPPAHVPLPPEPKQLERGSVAVSADELLPQGTQLIAPPSRTPTPKPVGGIPLPAVAPPGLRDIGDLIARPGTGAETPKVPGPKTSTPPTAIEGQLLKAPPAWETGPAPEPAYKAVKLPAIEPSILPVPEVTPTKTAPAAKLPEPILPPELGDAVARPEVKPTTPKSEQVHLPAVFGEDVAPPRPLNTPKAKAERAKAVKLPAIEPSTPAAPKPVDPVADHIAKLPVEDQAAAREAVKGWDGKSDPKGMIANIDMAVNGPKQLTARRAKLNTPKAEAERAKKVAEKVVETPELNTPKAKSAEPETPPEEGGRFGLRRNNPRSGSIINPIDIVAGTGRAVSKAFKALASDEHSPVQVTLDKLLRVYYRPIIKDVEAKGGEVGKEFAAKARAQIATARQMTAELVPATRRAVEAVAGLKGAAARKELDTIIWDEKTGTGTTVSHEIANGNMEVPANAAPGVKVWVDNTNEVFYKSGKQAEDSGVMTEMPNGDKIPFRADIERQRAVRSPTDAARWYADHPTHADSVHTFKQIAELNGIEPAKVAESFEKEYGSAALERPAALERARTLENMPTHIRLPNGKEIRLLETNPKLMAMALAHSTPIRSAFAKHFGTGNVREGVKEYVAAGGEGKDAENLFKTLNRVPLDAPWLNPKPGSAMETIVNSLGVLTTAIKSGKLSLSAVSNAPEPIQKVFPKVGWNVGMRAYGRAFAQLARHPTAFAQHLENQGAMNMQIFDWHLSPGEHRTKQIQRIIRDTLGAAAHGVERFNVSVAAQAGLIKAAQMKAGKSGMFDEIMLRNMDFKAPEIKAMLDGTAAPEQYNTFITRFVRSTMGHELSPAEDSRLGNSKVWNSMVFADRFNRVTAERFLTAAKTTTDLYKEGRIVEGSKSAYKLAELATSHMVGGATSLALRTAIYGGLTALGSKLILGDDKYEAWKDFLGQAFWTTVFGPAAQVILGNPNRPSDTFGERLSAGIFPVSVAGDIVDFTNAVLMKKPSEDSRYEDLDPLDATKKFFAGNLPISRGAANLAIAGGLGSGDIKLDAAIREFSKWRNEYAPWPSGSGARDVSYFRIHMKKAARLIQDGRDPSDEIKAAFKSAGEEKLPGKFKSALEGSIKSGKPMKAFNPLKESGESVTDSLNARRLLTELTPDQLTAAKKYLGPDTIERLQNFDAAIAGYAKVIKNITK